MIAFLKNLVIIRTVSRLMIEVTLVGFGAYVVGTDLGII